MTRQSRRPVYVAGVAEAPLGEVHDQNELSMVALAARDAAQEAGISRREIDGLFVNYLGEEGSVQLSEYLGIHPRYTDTTDLGGAAFEAHVNHAVAAISAGLCEVALVGYASRQRSRRGRTKTPGPDRFGAPLRDQYENAVGIPTPIGQYAMIAQRHMYQYGTTSEQLASVAVAARAWARKNPRAWARDPLSVDDVLASPVICDPLHTRDCCLVTDGGGAIILTTADRARDAAKRAVRVLGCAEGVSHWHLPQMADLTRSAAVETGRIAFAQAGVTPADIDVVEPYDSFTITVLMALEDLGFCAKGEGGAFVSDGKLGPGGSLPSMTSGGGLSYNHPGALGLLLMVEAVRQVRGEAGDRQVPSVELALVHGVGGMMSTAGTVVLGRD